MSMNCDYLEITPALLERLQATPELVEAALRGDCTEDTVVGSVEPPDAELFLKYLPAGKGSQMREMMQKLPPAQVSQMLEAMQKGYAQMAPAKGGHQVSRADLGESLALDKAWNGVHYLIYGSSFPEGEVDANPIFGGTPIGPEEGYGSTRYFTPAECRQIAEHVTALDMTQLRTRFDPQAMSEARVYPSVWDEADVVDWLMSTIAKLRVFFQAVVARGNAVLVHIG